MIDVRRTCSAILGAAWLITAAPSALADHTPLHTSGPSFGTLDRVNAMTRFGIDMALVPLEQDLGNALRLDVHGQMLMGARSSAYLSVPAALLFDGADPAGDRRAVGNLDVGFGYAVLTFPAAVMVRVGATAPSGSSIGDVADPANLFASIGRITDVVTSYPRAAWVRTAASVALSSRRGFVRADLGIDAPLNGNDADGRDARPLIRVNGGAGVVARRILWAVELAGLITTNGESPLDTGKARFAGTAGVTLRLLAGPWQPSVGAVVPVDSELRKITTVAFSFGIQGGLPRFFSGASSGGGAGDSSSPATPAADGHDHQH